MRGYLNLPIYSKPEFKEFRLSKVMLTLARIKVMVRNVNFEVC